MVRLIMIAVIIGVAAGHLGRRRLLSWARDQARQAVERWEGGVVSPAGTLGR